MLRFGLNAALKYAPLAERLGYDYIEAGLMTLEAMNPGEFEENKGILLSTPLRAETCNGLLPGSLKIVGPTCDLEKVRDYLDRALPRAKALGTRIAVFGSGEAKRIPEDFPREKAMEQLKEFVRLLAEMGDKYDILFAIEPLRPQECNCINSLAEGKALMDAAASPRVQMLADLYHMDASGDTLEDLKALGDSLVHFHIACPGSRIYLTPEDDYDYPALFNTLKEMGYSGRMSFEGHIDDMEHDAAVCIKTLLDLRAKAGM